MKNLSNVDIALLSGFAFLLIASVTIFICIGFSAVFEIILTLISFLIFFILSLIKGPNSTS